MQKTQHGNWENNVGNVSQKPKKMVRAKPASIA